MSQLELIKSTCDLNFELSTRTISRIHIGAILEKLKKLRRGLKIQWILFFKFFYN